MSELPANPMSVELTIMRRRFWWHTDEDDYRPESWDVSADVSGLDVCPPGLRHVGDLSLVVADLRRGRIVLDAIVLGEWAPDFVDAAVVDAAEGRLQPELETWIADGPPRVVILRRGELVEAWRGHGLGPALIASVLESFVSTARLAACRAAPPDYGAQPASAEQASTRLSVLLERIGFRPWNGVHVVGMRSPELADARDAPLGRWR